MNSEVSNERLRTDPKSISLQEEIDLARRVIQYIFTVEKKKHVIHKIHIIKNILDGNTKNFRQIIKRVKSLLSQVYFKVSHVYIYIYYSPENNILVIYRNNLKILHSLLGRYLDINW